MNRFEDMLSFLRRREGLSQKELGDRIGVAKSTISMYENGTRKPSFEMLETIADYFNVNMDFLLGVEDSNEPDSRQRLLNSIDSMDRSELLSLLSYITERLKDVD